MCLAIFLHSLKSLILVKYKIEFFILSYRLGIPPTHEHTHTKRKPTLQLYTLLQCPQLCVTTL